MRGRRKTPHTAGNPPSHAVENKYIRVDSGHAAGFTTTYPKPLVSGVSSAAASGHCACKPNKENNAIKDASVLVSQEGGNICGVPSSAGWWHAAILGLVINLHRLPWQATFYNYLDERIWVKESAPGWLVTNPTRGRCRKAQAVRRWSGDGSTRGGVLASILTSSLPRDRFFTRRLQFSQRTASAAQITRCRYHTNEETRVGTPHCPDAVAIGLK